MRRSLIALSYLLLVIKNVLTEDHKDKFKDVITETGVVRGRMAADGDTYTFLGIPYASSTTGNNRFKAPLPAKHWEGIFEANRTVKCPQNGQGNEDCLIINVFTPTKIINELLPVLVYIHGGSFIIGAGQTKGVEPLIKEDIIVVTLNYRLGALGFLCLGTEEAPGNAGLKDQVAALRWVKNNIENFGGDFNRITLYGMSAGGASVEYHILSNMSRGLFQNAIVESGSATSVWAIDDNPIKTASDLANIQTKNLNKLLEYYQQISADELSKINEKYYNELVNGKFGFVPCIEKRLYGIKPFLTEDPYNILVKGKYTKVPVMFFFAILEGLYLRSAEYYESNYRDRMEEDFVEFLPADLIFDTHEIKLQISDNVKHFYFGNKTIGDNILGYLNYFGDYLILHRLLNSAEIHSIDGNTVYLMEFAFKGNMGTFETFYDEIKMAGHGDVIKHAILNKPIIDSNDKIAVARIAHVIANFVKYGNPTPERSHLMPLLWPTVKPHNITSLYFGNRLDIIEEPHWDQKIFWDRLYEKFRKPVKSIFT